MYSLTELFHVLENLSLIIKIKYLLTIHHLFNDFKENLDTYVQYLSQLDLYSTFAKYP